MRYILIFLILTTSIHFDSGCDKGMFLRIWENIAPINRYGLNEVYFTSQSKENIIGEYYPSKEIIVYNCLDYGYESVLDGGVLHKVISHELGHHNAWKYDRTYNDEDFAEGFWV